MTVVVASDEMAGATLPREMSFGLGDVLREDHRTRISEDRAAVGGDITD
jgi:hypothetical protein